MPCFVQDRIKQITGQLKVLSNNVKEELLDVNKEKARQQFIDLFLLTKEARYASDSENLDTPIDLIEMQLERLETINTVEDLKKCITRVSNIFSGDQYNRPLTQNKNMRELTDSTNSPLIEQVSANRELNVLMCHSSDKCSELKHFPSDGLKVYALFDYSQYYPKNTYYNVAVGMGGTSSITNKAFDVLVMAPDTRFYYEPIGLRGDIIPKYEHRFLIDSIKYLRSEGLICYTLAYTRLDMDICMTFARYFKDVKLTRIDNIYIEVTGIKKDNKELDSDILKMLRSVYTEFQFMPTGWNHEPYELPLTAERISSFRGSVITNDMLEMAISKSNGLNNLIQQSQTVENITTHKPLLPFNTGQISLVLASGCLDGVVDEDDEHCHLIKGRIKREIDVKRDRRGNEISSTSYYTVEINALTPEGNIITIH